jgi:uncharacterized caspase-like protein
VASRYRALLIGNSTYPADEHNLPPLKGPARDIAALRDALVDPATGLFAAIDITLLPDAVATHALRGLSAFFGAAHRDDVLLLYFSGHGKLDRNARLHLCMHDTETTDLLATAVSSTRINEFVEASRARSVAIVLDCCYAGAFRGADLGAAVSGPGRYVLTSCRGTQLADDATDDNGTSYFTQHLVDGLTHSASDQDGDGYVSFSDLYAFVDRELRREGKQIPQRRVDGDGDLRLARRAAPTEETVTASTAPQAPPVAAGRAPSARRRWAVLVGVAAVLAAVAVVALLLAHRTTTTVTSSTSGTYTTDGPWRLLLRDTFVGNDPGCTISLVEADSGQPVPLPTRALYSPIQWQIQHTGTLEWHVNDRSCVVTPLAGTGSLTLPTLVSPTNGDSDAFPVHGNLTVQVTDIDGNSRCTITLVDAATGTPLDAPTVFAGQAGAVPLHPGSATTAYINPGGCGVRVSANSR